MARRQQLDERLVKVKKVDREKEKGDKREPNNLWREFIHLEEREIESDVTLAWETP